MAKVKVSKEVVAEDQVGSKKKAKKAKASTEVNGSANGEVKRRGRVSLLAGFKIKKVKNAENPAREGTLRYALVEAILASSDTDSAIGVEVSAGEKTGRVTSADIKFCKDNGLIELV